jgi:hypothetical protein
MSLLVLVVIANATRSRGDYKKTQTCEDKKKLPVAEVKFSYMLAWRRQWISVSLLVVEWTWVDES